MTDCDHDWIVVEWRTFVDPPMPEFVFTERFCRRCGDYARPVWVDAWLREQREGSHE